MQGTLLAVIHPDNTPHGYNLTFAFPMLMFIIVAGALYLRFRGSHRVPGHVALESSRWAKATTGAPAGTGDAAATSSAVPAGGATTAVAGAPPADDPADESTEDGE